MGNARRQAGWSAIAFAVLFGVGNAIWGIWMPDAGAPAAEVLEFYEDRSTRIEIGGTLSLLSIAAFTLFAAALRKVMLDEGADEVLATTAFGGALLAMAAGIGAEAINMSAALRAGDGDLDAPLARSLFEVSQVFGSFAAGLGVAVFALATGVAALRTTPVLPRWAAVVLLVAGVVLLTPLARINVLPGGLMILLTAMLAVVLLRPPSPGAGTSPAPPGGAPAP